MGAVLAWHGMAYIAVSLNEKLDMCKIVQVGSCLLLASHLNQACVFKSSPTARNVTAAASPGTEVQLWENLQLLHFCRS